MLLLVILVTACAPVVEVEDAQPVEDAVIEEGVAEETEEVVEEVVLEKEEAVDENVIEITKDGFNPVEKTVEPYTDIKWVKKDDPRDYKIACYLGGARATMSSNLKEGDHFIYTFINEGEYTCLIFPYGLRSTITVETAPLLSPTGRVVTNVNGGGLSMGEFLESIKVGESNFLGLIAILSVMMVIFFVYGRKR